MYGKKAAIFAALMALPIAPLAQLTTIVPSLELLFTWLAVLFGVATTAGISGVLAACMENGWDKPHCHMCGYHERRIHTLESENSKLLDAIQP